MRVGGQDICLIRSKHMRPKEGGVLGKTRKRAYQSAVVILNVAIDLIAVHFMYHVVFSFLVIRAVYLRRNVSRAVFAI